MSKAIVLLSGGLDSSTCLALTVSKHGAGNVIALSLYYGQKHKREIKAAEDIAAFYGVRRICFDVKEIFEGSDCSLLEGSEKEVPEQSYGEQLKDGGVVSTYVPFRNGLFLSIATSIAIEESCNLVYYGAHRDDAAGDAYPDCSQEFGAAMSEAIWRGSGKLVQLSAPFIKMNKAGIVKKGLELGVPYELTWSCYNGGERPCGKCGTCIDRRKAFEENGVVDPL